MAFAAIWKPFPNDCQCYFFAFCILTNFQRLYDVMNDAEKHDLMETLIADIQVYPQRQPNGQWLKSIHFKLLIIPEEEMQFGLDISDRDETVMSFSKGTAPLAP